MGVVAVDQPDIALVPDAMRAAHDVIDDIGIDIVETFQRLAARPVHGGQIRIVAPLDLQDLLDGFAGFQGGGLG